jgi:hypothetical protein
MNLGPPRYKARSPARIATLEIVSAVLATTITAAPAEARISFRKALASFSRDTEEQYNRAVATYSRYRAEVNGRNAIIYALRESRYRTTIYRRLKLLQKINHATRPILKPRWLINLRN